MSNKKIDIKSLAEKKILEDIENSKKQLLSLRFKRTSADLNDVSLFKKERKNIARLRTELSKRKIAGVENA